MVYSLAQVGCHWSRARVPFGGFIEKKLGESAEPEMTQQEVVGLASTEFRKAGEAGESRRVYR
jgi:hypothetical protein